MLTLLMLLVGSNLGFYFLAYGIVKAFENQLEHQQQDIIALDKYCTLLENRIKYISQVRIEKEKILGKNGDTVSQHYLDLPDLKVAPIIVPYTNIQSVNGVQYKVHYNQIWKFEDWQASQKGKYWIKNKYNKKGRTYVKGGKWVDELYKGDEVLDYFHLDFDAVDSDLPCKWEYKGYEELARVTKRSTKRKYAVSGV